MTPRLPELPASSDRSSPGADAANSAPGVTRLEAVLSRPPADRQREYRYRFAQSLVFGVPVLALEFFGRGLGGAEAGRWVAALQALLAGWILYVGAAGMLFEGALLLARRRVTPDLIVATAAALMYGLSAAVALRRLAAGEDVGRLYFAWSVLLIAAWTGFRAWSLRYP